jgi:ATP-dependent Lon protease
MSIKNENMKIIIDSNMNESKNLSNKMNKIKIQQKINFFFKIITETIISVEKYKTNDIISASELNLCIQNLENIYNDLKNIENSIELNNLNSKQIITKLQTINDELSIVFKTFGTNKIDNILTVCYGNDFVNKIKHNIDKEKLELILNFVQPISYKILPWKNKPKNKNINNKIIKNKIIEDFMIVEMGKNVDCYDLCRTSNNFYTKVFGIKVVFQNTEKKNTIIISGVVTELLLSCLKNTFINSRIENCIKNKPNDQEFKLQKFEKFVVHLSIKEWLIYNDKELYNRFVGYNNQASLINQKSISQVIKEFINNNLFQQRKTLIILLLQIDTYEYQYLAYLLYDLLSNEQNGNIDTFEQTILFDSFPWEIKKSFRLAMKNTIKYTKHLSQFDNSKIPIEQQICLMKASETIKEKAMIKLKEVKAKSEDSGSKARQYLEGLLKIPFGIYKKEFILNVTKENSELINEIITKLKTLNININQNDKNLYTNIEITNILNTLSTDIFQKIDELNNKKCINYFTIGKKNKLITNICFINSLLKKHNIKLKKICHSGKKNTYMKNEINNIIIKLKHNQIFMKDLVEITNSSEIIHKNFFIEKINKIETKKKYIKKTMEEINETLDKSIYGHEKAKRQLERVIGQWITGKQSGYCFGFEGPPGVGKTSLAKNGLSKCLKDKNGIIRPFSFIALGGSSNGSTLSGHNYTYVGSTWGRIVDILMEKKCMNPIIFIDELDKVSRTEHGKEIIGILTHLIDSTQNEHFQDKYFNGIDLDVSKILFIFSYNDVSVIDKILLDRIHRIKFDYLTINDKINIVQKYLLPEIYTNMGMDDIIRFADDNIIFIIDNYTNEAGVRKLKEIMFEIISEINLELLKETAHYSLPIHISNNDIEHKYLKNRHKISKKNIHEIPQIGVINGLWANSMGLGGIIPIQCSYFPANNLLDLKLTGMQGDVMKESMNVAKTLAWNLTDKKTQNLFIKNNNKSKNAGLHIHCPEGAVPKDGPSAGTAITIAIYSLINKNKIKNEIAITGEINLQGHITEIGGLELKILGGLKAGIKTFLFPKTNHKDYIIFLEKYKNIDLTGIVFHEVHHIEEVFDIVFI